MFNGYGSVFIWLIVLVAMLIIEMATLSLTTIWFAGGALVAIIASMFGAKISLQVFIFLAVSLLILFLLRPSAVKYFNGKRTKTNASSLIGHEAKVLETVDNDNMTGKAIVNGQEWTARAVKDDMIIEKGEKASIVDIKGVKLILNNIKEEQN